MKRELHTPLPSSAKRQRLSGSPNLIKLESSEGQDWRDWPAPQDAMDEARAFITNVIAKRQSVLLVPDKDADGLSAGTLLYHTLRLLGLSKDLIHVHHLQKGTNVHTEDERLRIAAYQTDVAIILDQGSRPGPALLPSVSQEPSRVLIIDHHMSTEWPDHSTVLTACNSTPIATASLLTYMLVRDMHPQVRSREGWRAIVGVFGDLGPKEAKWGTGPWPGELGEQVKILGSKNLTDAVAAVNAPRRTAEYNVPKAWQIYLEARTPSDIVNNAFFKLCKIDVREETERWARTAPKFSSDGRVAVITIHSACQIHPVIATRWAGNLGRKSKKLEMVMCANTGFNPDPSKVSFSCRIASSLRGLPDDERPNLIQILKDYAAQIEGFRDRVGEDFARGHKEATGGIIAKVEFDLLLQEIGIPVAGVATKSPRKITPRLSKSGIANNATIERFFAPKS